MAHNLARYIIEDLNGSSCCLNGICLGGWNKRVEILEGIQGIRFFELMCLWGRSIMNDTAVMSFPHGGASVACAIVGITMCYYPPRSTHSAGNVSRPARSIRKSGADSRTGFSRRFAWGLGYKDTVGLMLPNFWRCHRLSTKVKTDIGQDNLKLTNYCFWDRWTDIEVFKLFARCSG